MPITRTEAVADGLTDTFSVSFPYLDESHVFVFVKLSGNGFFEQYTQGFSFNAPNLIQLNTTPAADTVVSVRRITPCDDLLATLTAPSTLSDDEINLVNTQLLYLIQENKDASLDVIDEGVIDILSLLRFTYDIALSGPSQFELNDVVGPVPVTENITLAVDLEGSKFAGPLTNPASDHVITLYSADADGSNETSHGTITVSSAGVVTVDVPSIVLLAAGKIVYLRTTTAEGMTHFGVTLRGYRV
jgi:hypothetical protein